MTDIQLNQAKSSRVRRKATLARRASAAAVLLPPSRELNAQQQHDISNVASHSAATARALLLGKLMIAKKGKFKAARFFRPKDFVEEDIQFLRKHPQLSAPHHAETRTRIAKVVNFVSIFGAGLLLFEGYAVALTWLETYGRKHPPTSSIDENTADARRSALAGSFGGLLYGLTATPMMSLLRTGGPYDSAYAGPNTPTWTAYQKWTREAIIRPLRYALPRDCGGFAIYFGTYTFLRNEFWESELIHTYFGLTLEGERSGNDPSKAGEEWALWQQLGLTIGSALLAGSSAGVLTFFWRNPWDSLYKRQMGWENATTHGTWWSSGVRFLRSPRGLQAVGISGITWAAYETAILMSSLAMEEFQNEATEEELSK